jgi:hypothetical protein
MTAQTMASSAAAEKAMQLARDKYRKAEKEAAAEYNKAQQAAFAEYQKAVAPGAGSSTPPD